VTTGLPAAVPAAVPVAVPAVVGATTFTANDDSGGPPRPPPPRATDTTGGGGGGGGDAALKRWYNYDVAAVAQVAGAGAAAARAKSETLLVEEGRLVERLGAAEWRTASVFVVAGTLAPDSRVDGDVLWSRVWGGGCPRSSAHEVHASLWRRRQPPMLIVAPAEGRGRGVDGMHAPSGVPHVLVAGGGGRLGRCWQQRRWGRKRRR